MEAELGILLIEQKLNNIGQDGIDDSDIEHWTLTFGFWKKNNSKTEKDGGGGDGGEEAEEAGGAEGVADPSQAGAGKTWILKWWRGKW